MSVAPPGPIEFTLDAAELLRMCPARRQPASSRSSLILAGMLLIQGLIAPIAAFAHHETYRPLAIVIGLYASAAALLAAIAIARRRIERKGLIRTEIITRVRFDNDALEVGFDDTKRMRSITVRTTWSVAATTEAIVIRRNVWPTLVIPRRVLADGGEHLMRYFEDRLIGKRMLRTPITVRATIVNSLSR